MRILLVEDEQGVADFLGRGLREAGYAVDTVGDGRDALDYITLAEYDLIVLDLMLPGIDGIEVLERARARRVTTPVLLLTAREEVTDKVRGLDSGADDYLTKPFAFPELLARLRALLRRPPHQQGTILRVQDVEMDVARRLVRVSGKPLDLSPREFSLLELFLRNPGQVLTRTQISQAVWDNSFCTGTNVIDVYVGYLRRKIGRNGASSFIQTVRGVGYRVGENG